MNGVQEELQGNQNFLASEEVLTLRWLRNILWFCLFEAAFYFAYRYGMSFSHDYASPFWFPDSVLLCALLLSKPRNWWVFVLAPLPIRLFVAGAPSIPLWFLLATFVIDSAKGLIAAGLLRRFNKNPTRFETVQEFGLFCLFAVLLIPAVSAFAGAGVRYWIGSPYWPSWEQWFMGDALAQLVITPAILYWVFGKSWKVSNISIKRCIEGTVLTAGLILTGYIAFDTNSTLGFLEPRFYAPVPFLLWAALRFGMMGASGAVLVMTVLSVEAALEGRGPFAGQSPVHTARALQHYLFLRAFPLCLIAVSIEQRRGVERSLKESEERFRYMANTAPVFIWMTGPDKLLEWVNQRWLAFSGRTMDRELGNGWTESVHPNDLQHFIETYHSSFDARQSFEIECRLSRQDGEYRWILSKGVPRFDPNGNFLGYIGSAIDITDRKLAEEAKVNMAHVQRLATMGEFTAMIAHEVNQPLGAILSNADAADMLLDSDAPPLQEIREILADIRKDDLRADEAIRSIRAWVRKQEMQLVPLDLNDIATEVLRLVAGDAVRRGVDIQREFALDLPLVLGNRSHLQQVFLNLIFNAMDAMKDIPASERKLTVQTKSAVNHTIEVAVKDCGCGIPLDGLPHIFESFFTTKAEGMGLGLSIARSIIESHHGRIWAENNSGSGATVHFTIMAANGTKSSNSL